MIEEVELGRVCQFENGDRGKNYPSQSSFINEGIPFINAGNLCENQIDEKSLNFISEEKYNLLGSGKLQPNDILFCLRGSLGKFAINSKPLKGAIASSLVLLRVKDELEVNFLKHYLKSDRVKRLIFKSDNGSSQPNLSASNVKKFPIPLPPLEQQKKIAAILDAADAYRQKTKALIAKYDELTQSLFLDMFGDPVTNPKGWRLSSLIEVVDFENGDRSSNYPTAEDFVEKGIPFLSTSNIKHFKIVLDDLRFISEEKFQSLRKGHIFRGNLIITLRGSIGQTCIFQGDYEKAFINAQMMIMKPKNINNIGLNEVFKSETTQLNLKRIGSGSAQPQLTAKQLEKYKVICPPLNLQSQFSERVQAIETQKAQAQASLEKAEELFASLLQRAFKGELLK